MAKRKTHARDRKAAEGTRGSKIAKAGRIRKIRKTPLRSPCANPFCDCRTA